MMRLKIGFLLSVFIGMTYAFSYGQDRSKTRWQEVKRLSGKDKQPIDFTDTFYLQLRPDHKVNVRMGSFMYRGILNHDTLILNKYFRFKVLQWHKNTIKLEDKKHIIHVFNPDILDKTAADALEIRKKQQLPEHALAQLNKSQLLGHWKAYKRIKRNGQPVLRKDFAPMLWKINITTTKDTAKYLGTAYPNSPQKAGVFKITKIEKGNIYYRNKSGKTFALKVLRQHKNEWMAEGPQNVIYYFKRN